MKLKVQHIVNFLTRMFPLFAQTYNLCKGASTLVLYTNNFLSFWDKLFFKQYSSHTPNFTGYASDHIWLLQKTNLGRENSC